MNDNRNIEITRQTVLNFRFFDAGAMTALRSDLSLALSVRELLLLRDHFRVAELRDPTVGELKLLSALFKQRRERLSGTEITGLAGTEEQQRIFADILRMHKALDDGPLTLQAMMRTAGRYLERSGISPYHKALVCGATAGMAAIAGGQDPALALDLGNVSAMLAPKASHASPRAQTLVLLSPTGNAPFPFEVARFLASHRDQGVYPLAATQGEGILPHLLALGQGFFLDLAPFAHRLDSRTPESALSVGQNVVLLCAPGELLPRLMAEGAPVTVCGALNNSRTVQIGNGPELLLSLSLRVFSHSEQGRSLPLQLSPCTEQQLGRRITASQSTLLGGVATRGGCTNALLSLIGELIAEGANGDRMTLTCAAELPSREGLENLATACPAILEFHRVVAELALPCVAPALQQHGSAAPTLTVFVCAERGAPPAEGFLAEWQAAANARNYAALRRLLRHRNNSV